MSVCPCRGCKERTVEPNCHDEARCEKWAGYCAQKRREQEARAEDALINKRNNLTAVKTKSYKGWAYVQGDVGGIEYAKHKKRYLPAGGDQK